jgi:hypothetical protein
MPFHHYQGETQQAESGQWGWVILRDGEDYCRGAGYDDEDEADEALCAQLVALGESNDDA